MVNLALLACTLRATTKKGHQLFECTHRENPGYAYETIYGFKPVITREN